MFCRIRSFSIFGIKPVPVCIEVEASQGLPGFTLVGLPDNAVRESRERVASAVRSIGKVVTGYKTTVNVSPADLRKESCPLDLPLAIGLMVATHEIDVPKLERLVFVGELSLDGLLKPVRGALAIASKMDKRSNDILVIPSDNENEVSIVKGVRYICAGSLKELVKILESGAMENSKISSGLCTRNPIKGYEEGVPDFKDIIGMYGVKRALEIAAAGSHNFLLVGSPGSGKTTCARCFPGILPEMTESEIQETSTIHSISCNARFGKIFEPVTARPFRSPHHSASMVSLVGGGSRFLPGEASLAHNGVLFLDDIPEFNRIVLEALREPLETGVTTITRASGTVVWPSRFILGAAMNPCPCGYSMDPKRECTCLPEARKRYREKISVAVLDRIDIQVSVPPVEVSRYAINANMETSSDIRKRVCSAREIQRERFKGTQFRTNSEMTLVAAKESCKMSAVTEKFSVEAAEKLGLVAIGYRRLLKIGRTIADLRNSDSVEIADISEALRYRLF